MPVRRLVALVSMSVAVLVGALVAVLPAAAAKDYRAEQFHARIVIEPGGSIVVTESVRFVFGPESFTYVYRELPARKTDGLLLLGATMDGVSLVQGKQAGQFELKKDDDGRRRIVWHFEPTSNAAHAFTLTYRAAGVAWQDAESDVLAWTLLPAKRAYAIACASGEIEYPESATLLGAAVLNPPATESQIEGRTIRFLRCPFERDASWVATLRFAPRTLVATPPAWQSRARLNRERLPLFLGLAALIALAGAGGFLLFGLTHRLSTRDEGHHRQEALPDGLPPALAGAILRPGAAASWGDALGAILDLGRRGVIHIEVLPPGGLLRKHEVRLTQGDVPPRLLAHERTLLDLLFNTGSGPRTSVTFSQLARTFKSARRWKRARQAVAEDLRAAGLLDPEREHTRRRVTVIGVGVLLIAFIGFILSAVFIARAGDPVLALPAAVLLVGIAGIVAGATLSPLSDEGQRRAEAWRAYRRHLVDLSGREAGAAGAGTNFERWLPYAAAFGTAVAWAKRLEKQGLTEGPAWLVAAVKEGAATRASLASTIAVLSAGSHVGAHAGGSAAGGAGAAGGGASGAG